MILILCKTTGLTKHVIAQIYRQIGFCFEFTDSLDNKTNIENIFSIVIPENTDAEIDFSVLKKFIVKGGTLIKIGKTGNNELNEFLRNEFNSGMGHVEYTEENLFLQCEKFLFPNQKNSKLLGKTDKLGRIIGKESLLFKTKMHSRPQFDIIAEKIFTLHEKSANKTNMLLVRKWLWPNDNEFSVFVSHDVDALVMPPHLLFTRALGDLTDLNIKEFLSKTELCFRYSFSALKSAVSGRIDFTEFLNNVKYEKLQADPWFTIIELAKAEEIAGIKPSFFFLDNCSLQDSSYSLNSKFTKNIINELKEMDFEIALHSGFQTSENAEQMKLQKTNLDKAAGIKIKGVRQHRLKCTYPLTWKIQKKSGLDYDSTCLFNDLAGFSNGTCMPFETFDYEQNKDIGMLELPVTIMDVSLPISQGKDFNYTEACTESKKLISEVISKNGMIGLLWHPLSFENKKTRKLFESKFDRGLLRGSDLFWELLEFAKKNGKAWFASGNEISEWWTKRNNAKITVKKTLKGYQLEISSDTTIENLTLQIKTNGKIKHWQILNADTDLAEFFSKNRDLFITIRKSCKKVNIALDTG